MEIFNILKYKYIKKNNLIFILILILLFKYGKGKEEEAAK